MAGRGTLEQGAKARLDDGRWMTNYTIYTIYTNYTIFCCFFPPQEASPGKPRVLHTAWRSHGLIKCLSFLVTGYVLRPRWLHQRWLCWWPRGPEWSPFCSLSLLSPLSALDDSVPIPTSPCPTGPISLLPKLFTVALPLAPAWGGFQALPFGRSSLRGCLGILPNSTSPACAQKAVESCGGLDCSSLGANSLHPHPGRLHAD